jgi:hypothetical protein
MLNPLSMLFGAALVALGVLASAYADRIRGLRVSREATPVRARTPPVFEVEAPKSVMPKPPKTPKASAASMDGGEDVIAALIASGYKKAVATEATWACGPAERASVETWVSAALHRCARGGLS